MNAMVAAMFRSMSMSPVWASAEHDAFESRAQQLEDAIGGVTATTTEGMRMTADAIALLQQQMQQLAETQGHIMRGLGVPTEQSAPVEGENAGQESTISV